MAELGKVNGRIRDIHKKIENKEVSENIMEIKDSKKNKNLLADQIFNSPFNSKDKEKLKQKNNSEFVFENSEDPQSNQTAAPLKEQEIIYLQNETGNVVDQINAAEATLDSSQTPADNSGNDCKLERDGINQKIDNEEMEEEEEEDEEDHEEDSIDKASFRDYNQD